MKKRARRNVTVLAAALAVVSLSRLILPVSPVGYWKGPDISCMCGLGFLHLTESQGQLFVGCDHPPKEGWLAPLVQRDRQTWELQLHDCRLNADQTDYVILTNRVIVCRPGWIWMHCTSMPKGNTFRLRRDLSRQSRQIIESDTPSFTTEQQAARLLKRIGEKVQQEHGEGRSSSPSGSETPLM